MLAKDYSEAITDFRSMDTPKIIQGVMKIGEAMQMLPEDLSSCENMQNDVKTLSNWATIFTNPKQLMSKVSINVMFHYTEIFADTVKLTGDCNSDYYNCGNDIADILVLTIGKPSETDETVPFEDFQDLPLPDFSSLF